MIPVKTVKIGETTFYVKRSFRYFIECQKALESNPELSTLESGLMMFYHAAKAGAKSMGVPFPQTYEEMIDLIDDYPDAMPAIYESLTDDPANEKK